MVHLVFGLRRKPSMTQEEFLKYWREVHGPLVQRLAPTLRIRRYDQGYPINTDISSALASVRTAPEPFDGVCSLWFDTLEDISESVSTKEGRAAARELQTDEARFIDLENSPIWLYDDATFVNEYNPSSVVAPSN
jgi:uncharacterized protein (TIGR02118 family)